MPERGRLNSWKGIAAHLERDVRTVTRWAKTRGLPVHHVPGVRSVFAYTDEIDRWLANGGAEPASDAAGWRPGRRSLVLTALMAGIALVTFVGARRALAERGPLAGLKEQGRDVIGISSSGGALWTHSFARPVRIGEPRADRIVTTDLDGDRREDVVASILVAQAPIANAGPQDHEALCAFTAGGIFLWSRTLTDVVRFRAGEFGPPWYTSAVRAFRSRTGAPRLLWLAHHHTWWPSIATVTDSRGERLGSFLHPGWLTNAAVLDDGTIAMSGVNNAYDADMLAVLNESSWPGDAPADGESEFDCVSCSDGRPIRYFVFPRSELNRASGSRHAPAVLCAFPTSIELRLPQSDEPGNQAEVIYEFSRDYRLRAARASDAYWAWHDRLEAAGLVDHPSFQCAERRGRTVRVWDRDRGWSEDRVGSHEALR